MTARDVYQCQSDNCQQPEYHPDQKNHHLMNLLLSRLDEQQRCWYVAVEAEKSGHGGTEYMSTVTGINVNTIRKGRREMADNLATRPHDRVRIKGGGRKPVEKKNP
ncbi:MAG: transposase [Chloroflexi bacterium]|jgi:hypothetical protein|nr:transposase [Chloroflexota bacterium]